MSKFNMQEVLAKVAEQNRARIAALKAEQEKKDGKQEEQITPSSDSTINGAGVNNNSGLAEGLPPVRRIISRDVSGVIPEIAWQDDGGADGLYYTIRQLPIEQPTESEDHEREQTRKYLALLGSENELEKAKEQEHKANLERVEKIPDLFADSVLSAEQRLPCQNIVEGESCCLVGKAGTGKTYTIVEFVKAIMRSHRAVPLRFTDGHKYLRLGSYGVVVVAFTNRAINNISKRFDPSTPIHFMTIHKLLEYNLEEYWAEDVETGIQIKKHRFAPQRHKYRPFPSGIHTIIFEESSMVSKDDLYAKVRDACHPGIQEVFLGDLQQIPPIYGKGILGYKINELPTYELTKIFRQAAENPIIQLAWDISTGVNLTKEVLDKKYNTNKSPDAPIRITFFEKKIDWEHANVVMGKFFCNLIDKKIYDPQEDIILVPYNEQLGSIELNKRISQHISSAAESPTYEIIAGFRKFYYAVGDRVMYTKREAYITKIVKNGRYVGKSTMPPSVDLHRDGTYHPKTKDGVQVSPEHMTEDQMNQFLLAALDSEDDVTNQASHIVTVRLVDQVVSDSEAELEVTTRGEFGNLDLAYAITIHKAQGSEFRKVFLLFHNSHHSLNRELAYTAVTRASQQLFIMCEKDSFVKAVSRQRIKGDTLEEKKAWFKAEMAKEELKERTNNRRKEEDEN